MVLAAPFASAATVARRANAAIAVTDRVAGIDVNVSNLTIASHENGRAVRITRIERGATQTERDRSRAKRERRRQREMERSRRAMNRAQYQLSKRQAKRARRLAEAGRPPVDVIPMGPRIARVDGVPLQSFRKDVVSKRYRGLRAARVAEAASSAQARRDRARIHAAAIVTEHGYRVVTEDVRLTSWARSWGRALAAFSPGLLVAAVEREARAVAALAHGEGGVIRATTQTALSQHCPCGERVSKRLSDRVHRCGRCELVGDRDAVSAVLAAFVVLRDDADPSSARVDYAAASAALPAIRRALNPYSGWQDTLSESTGLSAREGSFFAWQTSTPDSVAVARRIVGTAPSPTPDESGVLQTTSERVWMRTNLSPAPLGLRDSS